MKKTRRFPFVAWAVLVVILAVPVCAQAQIVGSGRIVRTPGDIVADGLASAQSAVRDPFATPEITQTPEQVQGFRDRFSTRASDIFLRMFEQLIAFFGNRLLVQAGLPPLFPGASGAGAATVGGTTAPVVAPDVGVGTNPATTDTSGTTDAAPVNPSDQTDGTIPPATDNTGTPDTSTGGDTTPGTDGGSILPRPGRGARSPRGG